MVKKLFALASVTALTGLAAATAVAGCSSSTDNAGSGTDADTAADVKKSDAKAPNTSSSGDVDGGDTTSPTCAAKDDIDMSSDPYTTAGVSAGACQQKDIDAMVAYVQGLGASGKLDLAAFMATVPKTCSDCVFTDTAAAKWGPFVTKDNNIDTLNYGGCIEAVSGNLACGKDYQQLEDCRAAACDPAYKAGATCSNQDDYDACHKDLQTLVQGPCKSIFTKLEADCGQNLGAYEDACSQGKTYAFEGLVLIQCVKGATGAVDGGGDAGDGG